MDVISPAYRTLQLEQHAQSEPYGHLGDKWAPAVHALVERFDAISVLDYGCGQGTLKLALRAIADARVRIDEYDPARPGKDAWPGFADLVVCTDVLEHVEPERLASVLAHLKMLARQAVFAVIALRPARRTLADGRNAHLIVESAAWWHAQLEQAGFAIAPGPVSPLDKPSRELSVILT